MCATCGTVNGCSECNSTTTTTTIIKKIPCHSCGGGCEENSPCSKCEGECEDYTGTNCVLYDGADVTISGISIKKNDKMTAILLKLMYRLQAVETALAVNSIVVP